MPIACRLHADGVPHQVILANEDCDLGDRTNNWTFALLKNWLRSAFVPVNRRFSVLQSVLQSCNGRLSASHADCMLIAC